MNTTSPESALVALTSSLVDREVSIAIEQSPAPYIQAHGDELTIATNDTSADALRALTAIGVGRLLDDEKWASEAYTKISAKKQHAVPPCWSVLAHLRAVELATQTHPVLAKRIRKGQAKYGVGNFSYVGVPQAAADIFAYVLNPNQDTGAKVNAQAKKKIDAMRTRSWAQQLVTLTSVVAPHIPPHVPPRPLTYSPLEAPHVHGQEEGEAHTDRASGELIGVDKYIPPEPHFARARRQLEAWTRDVKINGEPTWEYKQPVGRIDIPALITPTPNPHEAFKIMHYQPSPRRNIHVIIDASASARNVVAEFAQVSWALRGWGLGDVTTYVFSDRTYVWDGHTDGAVAVPNAAGGTNLRDCLTKAGQGATAGDIIVVCTDGDIPKQEVASVESLMDAMRATYQLVSWKKSLGSARVVHNILDIAT